MTKEQRLIDILKTDHPIIMAPMFLVSNEKMMGAALKAGISAAFPALNYRTEEELRSVIRRLKSKHEAPFGVNVICNKSNPRMAMHIKVCVDEKVGYVISSLGNPKQLITACHAVNIPVICDVTDVHYGKKVEVLGADAVIAVNSGAGGHCGGMNAKDLLQVLNKELQIPVISAGGIGEKKDIDLHKSYGAAGVSVGTIFIASEEAGVNEEYKRAIVEHGKEDIVLTTRLSGTPSTVINTPYVQSMDLKTSFLERMIKWFPRWKKTIKSLIMYLGAMKVRKAAFRPTYQTVWVAGPVIEKVKEIRSIEAIVETLTKD